MGQVARLLAKPQVFCHVGGKEHAEPKEPHFRFIMKFFSKDRGKTPKTLRIIPQRLV